MVDVGSTFGAARAKNLLVLSPLPRSVDQEAPVAFQEGGLALLANKHLGQRLRKLAHGGGSG